MVDGSAPDDELETARVAMVEALRDSQLRELPILLLVTHQDAEKTHPKSANEVNEMLVRYIDTVRLSEIH